MAAESGSTENLKRPRGSPTGTTPRQLEKKKHVSETRAKRALSYRGHELEDHVQNYPGDCSYSLKSTDVLWAGEVYHYTIPSFDVLTVDLRHIELAVKCGARAGGIKKIDAFMKDDSDIVDKIPATITVFEACSVEVSCSVINYLHIMIGF